MTLEENVESLFSQMASEEGRMIVISQIAGRLDLPERYFERAIRFYERAEDVKEVERLLAIERAIKLMQEDEEEAIAEMWTIARKKVEEEENVNLLTEIPRPIDWGNILPSDWDALIANTRPLNEEFRITRKIEELYNKALEDYNSRKEHKRKEIIEMYKYEDLRPLEKSEKERKNIENAADIAKEAGLAEKAMELYERLGKFEEAEKVAQKARLTEKAILYRTIQRLIMDDKYLQKWVMRIVIPPKREEVQSSPVYKKKPTQPPVYITKQVVIKEEREKERLPLLQQILYDLGIGMTKDAIYAVLKKAFVVAMAGAAGAGILIAKHCKDITETYEAPER